MNARDVPWSNILRWVQRCLLTASIAWACTARLEGLPQRLGDLNEDGTITVVDLVRLVAHMRGTQPLTGDLGLYGDVNQDGAINDVDAAWVADFILGKRPLPDVPFSRVRETSPLHGERDVSVTREMVFRLTLPLAPNSVVGNDRVYAEFGGRKLLSRIELSSDRRTLTLFYLEPMPGGARVRATFKGDGLTDFLGRPLDVDGDSAVGGTLLVDFDTLNTGGVKGTIVCGRVFASELAGSLGSTDQLVNQPLAGVTITVDGMEESLRAVTDNLGNFRLDPAPAGHFFVHIDGRTAKTTLAGPGFPNGSYYPSVGKEWVSTLGEEVNIGDIYLPLIVAGTLQSVSAVQETTVTFPNQVLQEHPELAGVSLTLPANVLFNESGTRGGLVGIAPVSPDRLPSPLPAGLQFPLVITVQTDGPANFDRPAPICFPNLPDPVTKEVLKPGDKSALWSFNHDIGDWEIVGPMTVSADGKLVCSDPGVGILQPGWHGTNTNAVDGVGAPLVTAEGGGTRERCSNCQPSNPTDPVNLFSGEFTEMATDLVIRGRGMDFTWQRFYRSQLGFTTVLGNNWNYSYNYFLESAGANLILRDGASRSDEYERQPNGTYVAIGFFRELVRNPDQSFTLTLEQKEQWSFRPLDGSPSAGRISQMVDRFGNRISFQYEASGRLDKIIDTWDREIRLRYDAAGMLAAIIDFTGRSVRYEYYDGTDAGGSIGDLKAVISPAVTGTPNGNDFPEGKRTSYTYTTGFADDRLNHNLLTITDGRRNDPNDPTFGGEPYLENVYASTLDPEAVEFDRVLRQAWGGGVIDIGYVPLLPSVRNGGVTLKAIVNDRIGNVREYFHDQLNRVVRERDFTGRAIPTEPTTELSNRPKDRLREGDSDYFETLHEWDSDSLLKRTIQPNGNTVEYVYEKDLSPLAGPRSRGNLRAVRRAPGGHVPAGDQAVLEERYDYDNGVFNLITRVTDPRGNPTTFEYDVKGNLTRVRHPIPGAIEEYEYNEYGQLIARIGSENGSGYRRRDELVYYDAGAQRGYLKEYITDAATLRLATTLEYDSRGNIIRTIDPRGNDTLFVVNALDQVVRRLSPKPNADQESRYAVDYFYDANNNLVRVDVENRDEQGRLRGNSHLATRREFDVLDNLVRVSQEIDENRGLAVEYEYDLNRNLILTRSGEAVAGRQPRNVTRRVYDERDMLYRTTRSPADALQKTVQLDYDPNGNLIRVLEGLEGPPRESRFTYDGFDRLVASTDAMGNVYRTRYNANGNAETEIVEGELRDAPGPTRNVQLAEMITSYDALNRPVAMTSRWFQPPDQAPLGGGQSVTRYEYAANSALVRIVNANGHFAITSYDTANRPDRVTDLEGNETRFEYNKNSSLVRVLDIEKALNGGADRVYEATFDFDNLERRISVTDNSGNRTRHAYDSRGLRSRAVDPLGNITEFEHDGLGRPLATVRTLTTDGTGATPAAGSVVTRTFWDDNSRVLERTDPNGNSLRYEYDSQDRPVRLFFADGTNFSVEYDVHGNEVRTVDANGSVATSSYDALDRLLRRGITPGTGVAASSLATTFTYDGMSRIVEAANEHSVVAYAYDSLSHVVAETLNGKATRYTHDSLGHTITSTYPGGREVRYSYDELERLAAVQDRDRPLARFVYEGRRRMVSRDYGNLTRSTYSHDPLKRIEQISHLNGPGNAAAFNARRFAWDPLHNKRSETELHAGGLSKTYRYDSIYRMTESARAVGTAVTSTRYEFDPAGNWSRKRIDATSINFLADATAPEPADAQMNQYSRAGNESLVYDHRGNLRSAAVAAQAERRFEFDAHDQLVMAEVNGQTTSYRYDALGRRIEKAVASNPPQVTRYFYTGASVCEEQDANGNTIATYVRGRFADDLISRQTRGQEIFYHADDQGNVVALTDASGGVIETYEYDDYGQTAILSSTGQELNTSSVGNLYRFHGRPFDEETGLYDFRSRYLDPELGRFISRDAIGIWGDPAHFGNGYAFVGNNPWSRLDPFGFGSRSNRSSWERFNDWIDSNPAGLGYVKAFFQLLPDSAVTGSVTLANVATLGQSETISGAATQAQDQMGLTQGERTALNATAGVAVAATALVVAIEAAPVVAQGLSTAGTAVNNAALSASTSVLGAEGTVKAGTLALAGGNAVLGAYGGGVPSLGGGGSSRAGGVLGAAQKMAERGVRGGDIGAAGGGEVVTRAATKLANMRLERQIVQGLRGTGTAVGEKTANAIASGKVKIKFVDRIITSDGSAHGLFQYSDEILVALRGRADVRSVAGTVAHETCHWGQWKLGSLRDVPGGYNQLHEVEAFFWGKVIDPNHVAGSVANIYRHVLGAYSGVPPPPPSGNTVDMIQLVFPR